MNTIITKPSPNQKTTPITTPPPITPTLAPPKTKASLKCRYDSDKNSAATTVSVGVGAVKLRATMTDATVFNGPSLTGLAIGVDKPGFFILDYDVPKKDFRFQFMNTVRVADKPLNLTYIHSHGANRTIVDGSIVFDSANKVSANHMLGSGNCKTKYTYVHNGVTTFEPCYDWAKNSWDFAVSQKVYGDDVFRAAYQTSNKALGLEWSRNTKSNGSYKIATSLRIDEAFKIPNVSAETTWNFDM